MRGNYIIRICISMLNGRFGVLVLYYFFVIFNCVGWFLILKIERKTRVS